MGHPAGILMIVNAFILPHVILLTSGPSCPYCSIVSAVIGDGQILVPFYARDACWLWWCDVVAFPVLKYISGLFRGGVACGGRDWKDVTRLIVSIPSVAFY